MVQAAAEGAIDFSQADPYDNWWWRRTSWILSDLLRKRNLAYLTTVAALNQAYLSNNRLDPGAYSNLQQRVIDVAESIHATLFPWTKREEQINQTEIDRLVQQWRDEYGDPNDPQVREGIEALTAAISHRDPMEETPTF